MGSVQTAEATMTQYAPYPAVLEALVRSFRYKPGWTFNLTHMDRGQGSVGLTLDITSRTYNSYHPEDGENYRVHHYVIPPPAAFNEQSWRRWLLDEIVKIETHEVCEFFRFEWDTPNRVGTQIIGTQIIGTNHHVERPYAPSHGPGNDPYLIREVGTVKDQRTSFRGDCNT